LSRQAPKPWGKIKTKSAVPRTGRGEKRKNARVLGKSGKCFSEKQIILGSKDGYRFANFCERRLSFNKGGDVKKAKSK